MSLHLIIYDSVVCSVKAIESVYLYNYIQPSSGDVSAIIFFNGTPSGMPYL